MTLSEGPEETTFIDGSPSALNTIGDRYGAGTYRQHVTPYTENAAAPARSQDKGKGVDRGRALERIPQPINPFSRAESLRRMNLPTVEMDVRFIRARYRRSDTFHDNPLATCAILDDTFLEPHPFGPLCNSVSGILAASLRGTTLNSSTTSTRADYFGAGFDASRDSNSGIGVLSASFSPSSDGSPTIVASPMSITEPPEAVLQYPRCMAQLPTEVLHQIYLELGPADFNSARHTCRSWYVNSLEQGLLETMLKRGGWTSSIPSEEPRLGLPPRGTSVEWLMSKRIARECALGPDWHGNGLDLTELQFRFGHQRYAPKATPFLQTSTIDFTELGIHYPGSDGPSAGIIFSVSCCSKFLMVAHGCMVYIYELNRGHTFEESSHGKKSGSLRPVTSVICPRRVLACSMDTSSRRYAIAVLMEGRMGLVCDLTDMRDHSRHPSDFRYLAKQDSSMSNPSEYRNRVSISSSRSRNAVQRTRTAEQPFVFPVIAAEASEPSMPPNSERVAWYGQNSPSVPNPLIRSATAHSFASFSIYSRSPVSVTPYPMLVEPSTPTLYAPLCSSDDLPRSVALCPQRRCVAFGCSSGIELHWVDALTGQDLNRWFPLTAPSDHLYFLPPRAGIDSAKKLRLISSAGRPGEQPVMAERFGGAFTSSRSGERAKTSPFWGMLPSRYNGGWSALDDRGPQSPPLANRDNSDHYRAVPLSDGYHILFTDPATGFLCLGSDAPVGGPTKLLRKIWFAGPEMDGEQSPVVYAAGSDLRHGVRVVAAYGHGTEQSIWLFSVPHDVYIDSLAERGGANMLFSSTKAQIDRGNGEWASWWNQPLGTNPFNNNWQSKFVYKDNAWPVQVQGQEIGKCRSVVDVAVDAVAEMTIWAFGRNGIARSWQIDSGALEGKLGKRFAVLRDGTIREVDSTGDVVMANGGPATTMSQPQSPISPLAHHARHDMFDGSASIMQTAFPKDKRYEAYDGTVSPLDEHDSTLYDQDGDVCMADMFDDEGIDMSPPRPTSPATLTFTLDEEEVIYAFHEAYMEGLNRLEQDYEDPFHDDHFL